MTLNIHWKDWCWSWIYNTLATCCEELTHWKRPWHWEWLKAGGEDDDRWRDGWMALMTQCQLMWTWAWAKSGRWWRTGKPGVLQTMGLQRVGHNWATEQQTKNLDSEIDLMLQTPWLFSHYKFQRQILTSFKEIAIRN